MELVRISRRAVLGTAAAAALRAEQSRAQPIAGPEDELKAAIEQQNSNYDLMKKSGLPFFTEPATVFRA